MLLIPINSRESRECGFIKKAASAVSLHHIFKKEAVLMSTYTVNHEYWLIF